VSKIEAVADLWSEDVELVDDPPEYRARRHVAVDDKAAVALTDLEADLLRGAVLYALMHVEAFAKFEHANAKHKRHSPQKVSAVLHGLAHLVERGEPSPRDPADVTAWRRANARGRR
jgi:hypothetical protein